MRAIPLLGALLAASVSLVAANPVKAFWGSNSTLPSHKNLDGESYQVDFKMKNRIYNSEGWVLLYVLKNGTGRKAKLVDCQSGKCIYYTRVIDDREKDKYIGISQIQCSTKKFRTKDFDGKHWNSWEEIGGGSRIAYEKFCL